jgi:aminomethyltransferase
VHPLLILSYQPVTFLVTFHALQAKGMDVTMTVHDDRGLLALQGPSAMPVLQKMTQHDLSKFYFGMFAKFDIKGVPCWVTRTG